MLMKLFLSWSGPESRGAAEALREWLPFVINAVEPWMSSEDIDAGTRWSNAIQTELESTRFGIIFVTKSNTKAPWLLFEAGALAKTLDDTFVCPYLIRLDPSDLPGGPLTQFQAKQATKDGTWQLLQTINRAFGDKTIPEERLGRAFEKWWPDLESRLQSIPKEDGTEPPKRELDDIASELLTMIRRIDRNVTGLAPRPAWPITDEMRDQISDEHERYNDDFYKLYKKMKAREKSDPSEGGE